MVKADHAKGAFSPEIQEYLGEVQFPRLVADTQMRYIVTVQSEKKMNQISSLIWQKRFKEKNKIFLHNVRTEQEARDWLKTIDAIKK